jgi:hypothetical protein
MRQWLWVLFMSWSGAALAAPDTTYDSIALRNAFGLRAAPVQPVPVQGDAVWKPPPDLKITGLVTVPPTKKVSFYVLEQGKAPKSYVLGEGEQQDDIQVVKIDGSEQTVRVKNQGVYVVLDFKTRVKIGE